MMKFLNQRICKRSEERQHRGSHSVHTHKSFSSNRIPKGSGSIRFAETSPSYKLRKQGFVRKRESRMKSSVPHHHLITGEEEIKDEERSDRSKTRFRLNVSSSIDNSLHPHHWFFCCDHKNNFLDGAAVCNYSCGSCVESERDSEGDGEKLRNNKVNEDYYCSDDSQGQQNDQEEGESKPLPLTHERRIRKTRRSAISSFYPSSSSSCSSLLFGLTLIFTSLIHSSQEQSFFSPSSDEWDGGSFRSGTYGNSYTCVNIPVNFTLCKNIGYTKMMIPNLLGHDSLQEAEFHAKSWVPLLGLQCHPDTQLFLCSLFSPICLDRPIYPCRSLCQGVQAKCEPRMLAYNYPWPSMLKCDQFPEDHDLCIRPGAANKSDGAGNVATLFNAFCRSDNPEMECPSCNQAHTCENIVDNFCRADFVFRAKYKKSKGTLVEFRKERWFKPRDANRRGRELRTLSLDSKDDCCATKLRPGFPYIVMGVKRGDDYVVTFAMQWNGKDKVLKNAVRTFRSMDCTNPLPMSVTAAGGKIGAERNGTNSGAGRRRRRKQGRRRDRQYGGCRVSAPGRN